MYFWLIAFIVILVLVYVLRSGIFHRIDIRIEDPSFPTLCVAYKFHIGSYNEIGSKIKCLKSLPFVKNLDLVGVYYDDPKTVSNFDL
jgi:hypothetical protein